MDIGIRLPPPETIPPVDFATDAERAGYDSLWAGELWGTDAFVHLASVAEQTALDLGTAIVNVYSRSPATLAMGAATLARVSGTRTVLGVGVSTPTAIESIHGLDFDRPISRTAEVIELVSQLTGGGEDRVSFDGETVAVEGVPPLAEEIEVYNAALGPANRRVTGRFADGWIPHNVPFPDLQNAFEEIAEAADDAGRDPDEISISPYVPAAIAEDPEEADSIFRGHVAYYVGSGEGYRKAVGERFPDEADRIAEAWREGDRDGAREAVTDEMIADLGIAGTPDVARDRFFDLVESASLDEAIVVFAGTPDAERAKLTLEALAPAV